MMNYILKPSLQHIVLTRTAIILWNHSDIKNLIRQFNFLLKSQERITLEWQGIESRLIENLHQLKLPIHLRKKILCFIKPIGLQILTWMRYCFKESEKLPDELFWTAQGTVDCKKMVEVLLKEDTLDIGTCRKLAHKYCLNGHTNALFELLIKLDIDVYFNENFSEQELYHLICAMQKEIAEAGRWQHECSYTCTETRHSLNGCHVAAAKYVLWKLPLIESEVSLSVIGKMIYLTDSDSDDDNEGDLPRIQYLDILCFLLSNMEDAQQIEILKKDPFAVLECFLDWPFQCFFMETVCRMWNYLNGSDFNWLLAKIINKILDGYEDANYQALFEEFWQQSPYIFKRYIFTKPLAGILLKMFIQIKDTHNIDLILRDATVGEKYELLIGDHMHRICREDFAFKNEWDLLKYFIIECTSSKEEVIEFKNLTNNRWECIKSNRDAAQKESWGKYMKFLDDIASEYNEN